MSTKLKIEPYVISIKFDNTTERVDRESWVIGADIQIGDKLAITKSSGKWPFTKKSCDGNLNGDFMFVVCSQAFKDNPTQDYLDDINRAYIQSVLDKDEAASQYNRAN